MDKINYGVYSGGAIAAVGPVELDISKCIFSDNEATDDGAMYIWKGTVNINNTMFDYNYVDGHAIWWSNLFRGIWTWYC